MSNRTVVLASGDGSTFQAIVEGCKNAEIVALICDKPNAGVLKRAEKLGVPYRVVPRQPREDRETYDKRLAIVIGAFAPTLVVLAGFMRILTGHVVRKFNIINIHPSLLPKYKGLNTYQRALDAGEEFHGTTIHEVTEELDAGPILDQRKIRILPDDTVETLKERTQAHEREMYPALIDEIARGQIAFFA